MTFIGNFNTGSIVRGGFNSRKSDGAPANFSSSGVLRVYRNATLPGTTSGVTWANGAGANGGVTPFDGVTGYHVYTVDASANPSFFVAGDYRVILSSGAVDNIDVTGTQIASFALSNRSCESNVVRWDGINVGSTAVRSNVVQISGISVAPTPIATSGDAVLTITSGILPNVITSNAISTDAVNEIKNAIIGGGDVDGYTLEEALKIVLAALAGKVSGGGTSTVTFRAADDSRDRITATVTDEGNRISVTLDSNG